MIGRAGRLRTHCVLCTLRHDRGGLHRQAARPRRAGPRAALRADGRGPRAPALLGDADRGTAWHLVCKGFYL
jgi:hypothetical protein